MARLGRGQPANWFLRWKASTAAVAHGTLTQTLGALTSVSATTVLVTGTTAQTLAGLTRTLTGTVLVQGALSQTLAALSRTEAGLVLIKGTLSQTLGSLTRTSSGQTMVTGRLAELLLKLQISSAGTVTAPAPSKFSITDYLKYVFLRYFIPGTAVVVLTPLQLQNLPTSDPHVVGQLWNNSGTLTISAG